MQARTANEQFLIKTHVHAQSIQCLARGWLTRRRLLEWKRNIRAATTIKNAWKRFRFYRTCLIQRYLPKWWAVSKRHPNGKRIYKQDRQSGLPSCARQEIHIFAHLRCLRDVSELQRSFVAQQHATVRLWEDMTSVRRFMDYHLTKTVVRIQVSCFS